MQESAGGTPKCKHSGGGGAHKGGGRHGASKGVKHKGHPKAHKGGKGAKHKGHSKTHKTRHSGGKSVRRTLADLTLTHVAEQEPRT